MPEERAEAFSSFEIQSIEEGVSILPATDSRRRMIVTIRVLQAELAELQEMFSTTQQQDTESTLRVGELLDEASDLKAENKRLMDVLERAAYQPRFIYRPREITDNDQGICVLCSHEQDSTKGWRDHSRPLHEFDCPLRKAAIAETEGE